MKRIKWISVSVVALTSALVSCGDDYEPAVQSQESSTDANHLSDGKDQVREFLDSRKSAAEPMAHGARSFCLKH